MLSILHMQEVFGRMICWAGVRQGEADWLVANPTRIEAVVLVVRW
jgi:hypothetical protein